MHAGEMPKDEMKSEEVPIELGSSPKEGCVCKLLARVLNAGELGGLEVWVAAMLGIC